jgi:hypothetical protein
VIALPLFVVGTAQAAIAGANPGITVDRPDLTSATATGSSSVQVCFNKSVANLVQGDFALGGYAAGNQEFSNTGASSTAIDGVNNKCVDAQYTGSVIGDINQYTIVTVLAGAVTNGPTGLPNRADSVTLSTSSNGNGTTGKTIAPNLTGIGAASGNALVFQFDKAVSAGSLGSGEFAIQNAAGASCSNSAAALLTDPTQVLVTFPGTGTGCAVSGAIQGEVFDDNIDAAHDTNAYNAMETQPLASAGSLTFAPALVSATLDPTNKDAIDYTFSKAVTITNTGDFAFTGSLGRGGEYFAASGGVTSLSTTVIQATFAGNLSKQQEYAVQGQVYAGAVRENVDPAQASNIDQSTKVGDNAGALSRGFTTGPDIFSITMNSSNDQATVNLDQRLCQPSCAFGALPVNVGSIRAYPNLGNVGAALTGVNPITYAVVTPSQIAGPQALILQFPSGTLANDRLVQFDGCAALEATAIGTANSSCDAFNVTQIVEPISASAFAKAYRYIATHKSARTNHSKHKTHKTHKTSKRA